MKAVIETSTGKALYLYADETSVVITADAMEEPQRALDIKSATHSVVTVTLPTFWVGGGVLRWDGAYWEILDQDAYDAAVLAALTPAKEAKSTAINAKLSEIITAGCPIEHEGDTLHIQMDDRSITKLTAMAATATGAISGSIAWPEAYSAGWITAENIRIPLATPGEGYALSAMVGEFFAALSQYSRDLKDDADAAVDQAALDAIVVDTGWPEAPGVPTPITATPVLIAQARLVIDGLAITGFGTDSGIASVTAVDAGVAYIEFSAEVTLPYLVWTSDGSGHRVYSAPSEQAEYGFLIRSENAAGDPEFPPQIQLLITKA